MSHNRSFLLLLSFFFFNDTATTEIYTLSLHDALPIYFWRGKFRFWESRKWWRRFWDARCGFASKRWTMCSLPTRRRVRSEEHTSELQSRPYFLCRLLLGKKKQC